MGFLINSKELLGNLLFMISLKRFINGLKKVRI